MSTLPELLHFGSSPHPPPRCRDRRFVKSLEAESSPRSFLIPRQPTTVWRGDSQLSS